MKIVILSSKDIEGGAARATYRLHLGMQRIRQDSTMVVRRKASEDAAVIATDEAFLQEPVMRNSLEAIQSIFIDRVRSESWNTLFSLPYPGIDVSRLPPILEADVLHLHWVSMFQSIPTIQALAALQKPMVWTLHDCSAFTGGCHYPAGCDRAQIHHANPCHACPQLTYNPFDLPARILQDKLDAWANIPITVVTPSQWLADCARQSWLFQDKRVEVIPYGLETDIFRPIPKIEAKQTLGLPEGAIAILLGANDGNEQRKGFSYLFAALQRCLENEAFRGLVDTGRITLLSFGEPSADLDALPVPIRSFGQVASDQRLCQIYSAADLFVLPSLEDNLPNTMLEAMSCGTPVLGFAAGGIPDAVIPGKTGELVPTGDVDALAAALLDLAFATDKRHILGQTARHHAETHYPLTLQADRYRALYEELCETQAASEASLSWDSAPARLDVSLGSQMADGFEEMAKQALLREKQILERELERKQGVLQETRQELYDTRKNLNLELHRTRETLNNKLHETNVTLHNTRIDLSQARVELHETRQSLNLELHETRVTLHDMRVRLQALREKWEAAQAELAQSRDKIAAMESSKFWKLRNAWVRLKQRATRQGEESGEQNERP